MPEASLRFQNIVLHMLICLTELADASFDHRSGIAAFAGWFRAAGRVHKKSKVSSAVLRRATKLNWWRSVPRCWLLCVVSDLSAMVISLWRNPTVLTPQNI
jgi:hypothetical protein